MVITGSSLWQDSSDCGKIAVLWWQESSGCGRLAVLWQESSGCGRIAVAVAGEQWY